MGQLCIDLFPKNKSISLLYMASIHDLIKSLEKGELPQELNFTNIGVDNSLDLAKVQYNTFYKSRDYIYGKFPVGFENLPGCDLIVDNILKNIKTPLEEIQMRRGESELLSH